MTFTKVPASQRRIEILIMSLSESGGPGSAGPMSIEELDSHYVTKDLDEATKQAIADHWPKYVKDIETAQALAKERQEVAEMAAKPFKKAALMATDMNLDNLAVAKQFRAIAGVVVKQISKSALEVMAISEEDIVTDANPVMKAVYRNRMGYLKDCFWMAENLSAFADKIEASENPLGDGEIPGEILEQLEIANAKLAARGANIKEDKWQL